MEVPQKKSPAATPRTARKLKTAESDPVSSPNTKIRTPKTQSPKVVADRRSPRTPANEVLVAFVRSLHCLNDLAHTSLSFPRTSLCTLVLREGCLCNVSCNKLLILDSLQELHLMLFLYARFRRSGQEEHRKWQLRYLSCKKS